MNGNEEPAITLERARVPAREVTTLIFKILRGQLYGLRAAIIFKKLKLVAQSLLSEIFAELLFLAFFKLRKVGVAAPSVLV
ncbi:hypothetical protein ALFP_1749 [Alcaligenes faecalis]|nr:hypothetical protein ALFP_1749 [Alcaligenes faecalis]